MTKELIEEARPDKLTAEEAVKLVLKRPGMYGLTRTDEFRKVEAERDAAVAAIERVQETLSLHNPNGRLVKEVLAALDGAPEPKWEYSVGFNDPELGWINDHADIHDSYEDARSDYSEPNWLVEDRVVRRRKAGPWEPVEGEKP